MDAVYLSTAYLAPIAYYIQMVKYPCVIIEKHCNYVKQTYRNRCIIATTNGLQSLSIPIEKPSTLKCPTKDIRIAEHANWRHIHWNAILSSYNSTPFFEYYEDDFYPFFEKKFQFLFDFNESLREMICNLIDIQPVVSYSMQYINDFTNGEVDCRETIHPKKDVESKLFRPYYQVFEEKFGFSPNLSIIDLLFNMGPESVLFIK